jgi:hypothetical protein
MISVSSRLRLRSQQALTESARPSRARRTLDRAQIAKFAGNHVVFAMAPYRLGGQLLVAALAIGVGVIEKIDANLARTAHRIDRRILSASS